jgi:aspartate kinase
MKFGGTSVGSAEAISQAADIVLEHSQGWDCLVVVVSAASGVTDSLTQAALAASFGDEQTYEAVVSDLRLRHYGVVDTLLTSNGARSPLLTMVDRYLEEFAAFCRSIHVLGEATPRAMDAIASVGERINARIMAALLRQRGARSEAVDATELIVTDATFQKAIPLMEPTRAQVTARLVPMLAEGVIPIVTGFVSATRDGVTTTLGRGGSDFSAAILGDCLDSDEVWIWTDVDGVMTADPRLVPQAQVIPVLSYSEVGELAYFGAKVLHPRTIRPVIERGIPLWVKNTFNPTCPGTRIVREAENTPGTVKAVTAIEGLSMVTIEGRGMMGVPGIAARTFAAVATAIEGLSMVTIEGRGMMGVPGIAARTFAAVASQGASVLMISQASSEQSICFLIPTDTVQPAVQAIEEEMALELKRRDIDRVWSLDDVVIVTVVGAGMRGTPGVAARTFGALGQANINVVAIAQGSSECSISLAVAADDAANAVQQIHSEVILNG